MTPRSLHDTRTRLSLVVHCTSTTSVGAQRSSGIRASEDVLDQRSHAQLITRRFERGHEGFAQLPTAIKMLFDGANTGKLVLRVADWNDHPHRSDAAIAGRLSGQSFLADSPATPVSAARATGRLPGRRRRSNRMLDAAAAISNDLGWI
jgi:hypothetical protein